MICFKRFQSYGLYNFLIECPLVVYPQNILQYSTLILVDRVVTDPVTEQTRFPREESDCLLRVTRNFVSASLPRNRINPSACV